MTPSGVKTAFAAGVDAPGGLAFNAAGDLFLGDANDHLIYEYTPAGIQSTFATGIINPRGLAFDNSGNLFVADGTTGDIFEFTPSGAKTTFLSGLGNGPSYIAFAIPEPSAFVLAVFGIATFLAIGLYCRRRSDLVSGVRPRSPTILGNPCSRQELKRRDLIASTFTAN